MKTKKAIWVGALAFLLLCSPAVSQADTVVRSGETISVNEDQRIEGDFYVAASIINLSGQVADDMSALGGKVTVNGSVEKDALLVGGSVDVHGPVGDDLRVIGGDVIIAEPVTGDVFVVAGTVTILSTASVGGDVVVYGGEVEIEGSVGGDVVGAVETLRIDGPVAGNVDVEVATLVLGDKADITGNVTYVSLTELTRSQNAKAGEITRNDPEGATQSFDVKAVVVPVFIVLFAALVWYLIARNLLTRIVSRSLVRGIRPTATGFTAFFGAPIVIGVLLLTVLGALVGITALFAFVLGVLIAVLSAGAVLGTFVLQLYKKEAVPLSPFVIVVGVGLVMVAALTPIVGPALLFVLFLITFGAVVDLILHP